MCIQWAPDDVYFVLLLFDVKFKQLYKFCRDPLYGVSMQINLFMLVMADCFHNSRICLFCNGLIRLYININWVTNKCTLSDIQTDSRYGCEEMEPTTPHRDMDSVNIEQIQQTGNT